MVPQGQRRCSVSCAWRVFRVMSAAVALRLCVNRTRRLRGTADSSTRRNSNRLRSQPQCGACVCAQCAVAGSDSPWEETWSAHVAYFSMAVFVGGVDPDTHLRSETACRNREMRPRRPQSVRLRFTGWRSSDVPTFLSFQALSRDGWRRHHHHRSFRKGLTSKRLRWQVAPGHKHMHTRSRTRLRQHTDSNHCTSRPTQ